MTRESAVRERGSGRTTGAGKKKAAAKGAGAVEAGAAGTAAVKKKATGAVKARAVKKAAGAVKASAVKKAAGAVKAAAATREAMAERHDSGGKVRLRLAADVVSRAVFDGARDEYRYVLHRRWAEGPTVLFVMMNPSTAEVDVDDPTVAKCQRYARRWGYGAMYVANTFGYRVTDQKRLLELEDPVGPGNDRHIREMARESELIVLAYGKPHARLRQRGLDVQAMLARDGHALHALKLCLDGTPAHPLYLRDDVTPVRMDVAGA